MSPCLTQAGHLLPNEHKAAGEIAGLPVGQLGDARGREPLAALDFLRMQHKRSFGLQPVNPDELLLGRGAGGDAGTPATPPDMAGIDLGDDATTPTDYNKDFMTVAGNSVASGWKHSGVGDIANAAYQQTKHVVTTPIEYYQQAVDAFKAGDTKAGLEAAQQGLISLTTFGSGDNNSPMGKVFASLLMHPLQQLQKQLDMDRKNGALPSAGAESVVNRIKDIPNVWNSHLQASENEVNNGVQNAVDDWKAGNGTGALSDILIKPFDSPIAGSVPGAGPFLQEEGHDITETCTITTSDL